MNREGKNCADYTNTKALYELIDRTNELYEQIDTVLDTLYFELGRIPNINDFDDKIDSCTDAEAKKVKRAKAFLRSYYTLSEYLLVWKLERGIE